MTLDGSHRTFNPDAEYVQDWRGNTYLLYEPLGETCDMPDCTAEAVRLTCWGEADPVRRKMTHWHGGVHSTVGLGADDTRGGLWRFCRQHGSEARARSGR